MKRTTGTDRSITRNWRKATQAVRAGTWRSEQGETSEALFLTSGFAYDNAETAAARFRVVVEDFQTTTHTPEALFRLIECYLSLGLLDEAQTAGAILGYNYQATEWYQDAYTLLTGRGLLLEPAGNSWLRQIWRQTIRGQWL